MIIKLNKFCQVAANAFFSFLLTRVRGTFNKQQDTKGGPYFIFRVGVCVCSLPGTVSIIPNMHIVRTVFMDRYIWFLTVDVGIVFLMETSQIEDNEGPSPKS